MKQFNPEGKLVLYVMEPEEELTVLQFIDIHKFGVCGVTRNEKLWHYSPQQLRLKGGYDRRVVNLLLEDINRDHQILCKM